jgi:cytochrome b
MDWVEWVGYGVIALLIIGFVVWAYAMLKTPYSGFPEPPPGYREWLRKSTKKPKEGE